MRRASNNRGFTLVEILVVMAISVILVGLVMYPLAQSFRLTREAQAMADAQDSARQGMELLSRDLGEAMFVYDNARGPVSIYIDKETPDDVCARHEGPLVLPVRQPDGNIDCFVLPYAKIDFILPKMTMHCNNPAHPEGEPRDYQRGDEAWPPCPVCMSTNVEAKPRFPLEQDKTVVRYFLGLRYNNPNIRLGVDPTTLGPDEGIFGWSSPYEGEGEAGTENQVVLYRVEFDPYDNTLFPEAMPIADRLADPIFFYRTAPNSDGVPCCTAWQRRARIIGMGKYQDLVIGTRDANGNVTAVEPTVSFKFTAIDNDTFSGTYSHDKNFDYPSAVPTVYRAAYGYWTSPEGVTVYRYLDDVTEAYTTQYRDVSGATHLVIMKRTSEDSWNSSEMEFDITRYLQDLEGGNMSQESISKPGTTDPPEVAFYLDYTVVPVSGGTPIIAFTPTRGTVYFSLTPPKLSKGKLGPVMELDPDGINAAFHDTYSLNRGGAIRSATLSTFGGRIVPGSEQVIGPDMTPTAATVRDVRYERVPLGLGDAALNQYKIDYDTGDIYFSPVFDQDLPVISTGGNSAAPIRVEYKVQFNKDGDVVKGDYVTKSAVTVHLGMRMFDPDSGKPHAVDLTNTIKVRNALR